MLILVTGMTAMKLVWETIRNNHGKATLWKLFKGQESNFQLYHANGENKLHFDEMMSTLNQMKMLSFFFSSSSLKHVQGSEPTSLCSYSLMVYS